MLYQIAGICVLLAFYSCYFLKMFMQKRQGIQTNQLGKGKLGFVKFIEVTMRIVTIAVPIAECISIFLDTSAFPEWARITGMCVAIVGTAVFIISVLTMKDSWRAGVSPTDKTELVTSGIYSISRNPAFLGFDLVYVGILLMFFNPVLLILSLLAMIMFHLQIVNVEEDFLITAFGEEYLNYRKRAGRYLGRRRIK